MPYRSVRGAGTVGQDVFRQATLATAAAPGGDGLRVGQGGSDVAIDADSRGLTSGSRGPGRVSGPLPRRRWRGRFTAAAATGDAVMAALAATWVGWTTHSSGVLPLVLAIAVVLWVVWQNLGKSYDWKLFGEGVEEYRRVAAAGFVAVGLVATAGSLLRWQNVREMILGLLAATVLTLAWRRAMRLLLVHRRRSGAGMNRAVLVGPTLAVDHTARLLSKHSFHGIKVVGALVPPGDAVPDYRVVPAFREGSDVLAAVTAFDADEVVLLRPVDLDSAEMRDLMWSLAGLGVGMLIRPMSIHVAGPRLQVRPVDGLPLLQIAHPQITGLARTVKSAIDRTAAAIGLLALLPVMCTIAFLVHREDGGPVFYRQTRIGEDGRTFKMLKFRSMHVDADRRLDEVMALNVHPDGIHLAIANDPRVTNIGRLLRAYSLDELPQLINVVRGEMALVGPRPPLPNEVEMYPEYGWFRMAVRPGLTGLWQIQGAARHHLSLEEALELDLRYVENWSLWYDFAILWKTIAVVLRGSGVATEVVGAPAEGRGS